MVKPGLAIIANCITPYRVNLHRLIAAGIPEFTLHTLITHGAADFDWSVDVPPSIQASYFGAADDSPLAGSLRAPMKEWRKGGRLIRHLHDHNVRAVICNGYRYISFLRVIRHCHRRGIPLFVNNDGNIRNERPLTPLKAWIKRRTYAWWLKRVAGVMPMGELGDQFFLKYGADPRQFYRVPYTPDYDAFAAVDAERLHRFRKNYGLSQERRYLVFSGRLAPAKRVDLLIDAFARLAADRPDWDLLIVGAGALGDDLRRRVPDELRTRVTWTGFLEQEELKLAYHASDVLVLPSDREAWAVVVQEAMACGLAVVASDVVGAAHELHADGVAGRTFVAGSVESLWPALREVTAPENIDRFRQRSREALAEWRARVDPVAEVRRALINVGVLRN